MTIDHEIQALEAERAAALSRKTTQLVLRQAVLDAAIAAGVAEEDSLPEPLRSAHDAYTSEIHRLSVEVAEIDRTIFDARREL